MNIVIKMDTYIPHNIKLQQERWLFLDYVPGKENCRFRKKVVGISDILQLIHANVLTIKNGYSNIDSKIGDNIRLDQREE